MSRHKLVKYFVMASMFAVIVCMTPLNQSAFADQNTINLGIVDVTDGDTNIASGDTISSSGDIVGIITTGNNCTNSTISVNVIDPNGDTWTASLPATNSTQQLNFPDDFGDGDTYTPGIYTVNANITGDSCQVTSQTMTFNAPEIGG